MPVDGTFGRLRAHNERLKMLSSKKRKKADKTKYIGSDSKNGIQGKNNNPEVIQATQEKFKIENAKAFRRQIVIITIAVILTLIIVRYLYVWIF
jgi:hypothetical protein